MSMVPSGLQTIRINSRFGNLSRQTIQLRSGMCLRRFPGTYPRLFLYLYPKTHQQQPDAHLVREGPRFRPRLLSTSRSS